MRHDSGLPKPLEESMQEVLSPSKRELQSELNEPRSGGANDITKGRAINVAVHGIRTVKLRMVESIECFQPELDGFGFGQAYALLQGDVIVVDPGTREESPACISGRP